jgi:hypothetical protein
MKSFTFLTVLSSALLAASDIINSGHQFGGRQQVKPLTFHRHNNILAVRGGQDEVDVESAVEPETIDLESSDEIVTEPSPISKKVANLKERLFPAVLMLGFVGALGYYLEEEGLAILTLILQVGMYKEMTNVIGGQLEFFMKWWWFLTASLVFNGPRLLPFEKNQIDAAAYGMTMFGIVSSIIRFQAKSVDAAKFREFMRQTAISAISVVSTDFLLEYEANIR